ncbi:ABC transporter ATP-binding protein [Parapedobacter koreensis]|uniref:Cu-processing system ATP-binding protein n=1 Tax=Parapedobacter koreensis TaxID=332977 RepID=A0A1H7RJI2_9SPHI|nr:ABC transporter ATP-binding protein [Parapedobacter koreensis]SEL59994.1 Cu-processing system ATP-binding protein [Parapedobacter koreensis]
MITIQHLSKKFGKLHVLDDVSLTLEGGQCIALIGPNGSGKTTLIKAILGMIVPQSGNITFKGKDIAHEWRYRNQIGYMPQMGRYPENMTIGQVLNMMKDIRKMPESALDNHLFIAFGLDGMLDKRMRTLSGGTRQKVSACLAFMFNPEVLILDEPTAGLDPLSTELLKDKIRAEKQQDKLIVITSHVLSDLDDLVTEVIYMQDGKPLFHKSLQALKAETGADRLSKAIAQVMATHELMEGTL